MSAGTVERDMMRKDSGFSMVELMIAMTVTLIVSGAIYGLLTSGSTAFRREPEMADRQQNIRMAMDLISRDVFNAGAALPTFAQVFSRVDPAGGTCVGTQGVNGCGPEGSLGAAAAAARAPGDGGDSLTATDVLEIVTTDEACPPLTVCSDSAPGGTAGTFVTRTPLPACAAAPGVVMMTDNTDFTLQMSAVGSPGTGECQAGTGGPQNDDINLLSPLLPWNSVLPLPSASAPPNQPVIFFYSARVVRYKIGPNNDPLDPGPALWRSRSGRFGIQDGLAKPDPDESGFPGSNSPWELVARGIEDLQIEYMAGDGLWRSQPPTSVATDWNSIVRQVRVTLSARASAQNLQGATSASGGAPDAIRGQLVTVVTPRAAFNELQMGSQIQ